MIPKFALLSNLLFTFAALAASPQSEASLARSHEIGLSPSFSRVESRGASNIYQTEISAGAFVTESPGTLDGVTATFTVPIPSGSDSVFSMWIGLDGISPGCLHAFGTGVDVILTNGLVSCTPWYGWSAPNETIIFSGLPVNGGDNIHATVMATSNTSATAIMHNLSTGDIMAADLNTTSDNSLCGMNAQWTLGNYMAVAQAINSTGPTFPLANFSTTFFTNAIAFGQEVYSVLPSSGSIYVIVEDGDILTFVSVDGSTVLIQYL